MRTLITSLILLGLLSCKEKKYSNVVYLPAAPRLPQTIIQKPDSNRYFYFSYWYQTKDGSEGEGGNSFVCGNFPSYKNFKSVINSGKIVITSIYEFKDSVDFNNFRSK